MLEHLIVPENRKCSKQCFTLKEYRSSNPAPYILLSDLQVFSLHCLVQGSHHSSLGYSFRVGSLRSSQDATWDAYIPYWSVWVQVLALHPIPGFCWYTPWWTASDGSSTSVPVTHMTLAWPSSDYSKYLGNRQRLSLCLSSKMKINTNFKSSFKCSHLPRDEGIMCIHSQSKSTDTQGSS